MINLIDKISPFGRNDRTGEFFNETMCSPQHGVAVPYALRNIS